MCSDLSTKSHSFTMRLMVCGLFSWFHGQVLISHRESSALTVTLDIHSHSIKLSFHQNILAVL